MYYHYLKSIDTLKDEDFDKIYPDTIRELSRTYWTPIEVAIKASRFLVNHKGKRVLDIGSGVGKFCFIGSAVSEGRFIGIEHRSDYLTIAQENLKLYNVKNVHLINSNIIEIDFRNYDSFYFFNPFHEYLLQNGEKTYKPSLYHVYTNYVKNQFDLLPIGTRIATYYGANKEIPFSYELFSSSYDGKLKFWIKNHKYENLNLLGEQLINNAIFRLKNLGFSGVNKQNIIIDEVYKDFFENMLRMQLGRREEADEIILNLLFQMNQNNIG